jgi:hypothetical protein
MIKYIIALMLLGLALSSHADSPNGGAAGKSGCYTVSGALDQTVQPDGSLSGPISGDIEGTVVTVGGPVDIHGVVVFRPVWQTWEVTGGIVVPLIGTSVHFENDFTGIFAQPPIVLVNTKMRVADGARKGNLTLHGWTDHSTSSSHLEYHGVICP